MSGKSKSKGLCFEMVRVNLTAMRSHTVTRQKEPAAHWDAFKKKKEEGHGGEGKKEKDVTLDLA